MLGGGQGLLLAEILRKHSGLKGILFDQLSTITEVDPFLESEEIKERCLIKEGNFFERVPQKGSFYLLKHILHNYDDEDALTILRNCKEAMSTDDLILVIDCVIPPKRSVPLKPWMDIEMMLLFNGKIRTENEFQELFSQAGLKLNQIIPTRSEVTLLEGSI